MKTVNTRIKLCLTTQRPMFLTLWYPHLCISEHIIEMSENLEPFVFLKTIVLIFLFTGNLKHVIDLSQILRFNRAINKKTTKLLRQQK